MRSKQEEIHSERIDDIPIIVEWLKQMEIAKWIDKKLKPPHGNHKGLSYGELSVLLLTYMMTQADHRLCAVEAWVQKHQQSLERTTGFAIGAKEATDDRLARVVEELGKQEEACQKIEQKLGQHLIRAYQLPTEVCRADTTSFSVNHQKQEPEAESLLRYGHSKDHRPDLRQYRQMLGTLDPAGIPLVSATLAGNGADDPLYYPTWERMAKVIGHKQFLFFADCKAAAIATRGQIAARGGFYCLPMAMSGQIPLWLQQWVLDPPAASVAICLPKEAEAEPVVVGKGFEVELGKFWRHPTTAKWVRWHERQLIVYSDSLAAAQQQGLHKRLEQAQAALDKLAAKPGTDLEQLNAQVQVLLKRHRVAEFFVVATMAHQVTQTRYLRRGRPAVNAPTNQVTQVQLQLTYQRQAAAIIQAEQLAGWRLYVTNAPLAQLSLPQAILYYRDEWLLERGFHRFKRGHLPALPIYFQNQDRIAGLMFLLTIALRVFTLIEFVVQLALHTTGQSLPGLYAGNPKRSTSRPSAEQLLQAFDHVTLYFLPNGTIFITPLSRLQQQILALMQLPQSLYLLHLRLCKT